MTDFPDIKIKVLPTFPAAVLGGVGLTATKANGSLTLDYAWQEFGAINAIPTSPTSYLLTYDTSTNAYVMVPSHLLGGAVAGIADAPIDGTLYGRQSGDWVNIPSGTPGTATPLMNGTAAVGTSLLYSRQDHVHPTDTTRLGDATSDGFSYGRLNGAWAKVLPLTGGTLTGSLILNADPTVALGAATKQYVDAHTAAGFDAIAPTTTRGDLIYRNATTNTRLGAGTAGYLLQTNGVGADPSWIGFSQNSGGSVARTWQSKVGEIVSVTDFGAIGNGSTDDLPAFNAAIAALTALGGGALWVPPKTFYLSDQVVVTNSAIAILGMDKHNSRLLFGPSCQNGLVFNEPAASGSIDFKGLVIENLTILTQNTTAAAVPGKSAILYSPASPEQGAPFETMTIRGVEIRGQNGFTHFWNTGIYANNAVNVIIDDVNILGKFNTQTMNYGVYTDHYAISVSVVNSSILYCNNGINMFSNEAATPPAGAQVSGTEGIQVVGCIIVGVGRGVVHDNGVNPQPRPLLLVSGCHVNAVSSCIYASNVTEVVLSCNLLYIQDMVSNTAAPGAACVVINNPNNSAVPRHAISGNVFRSLSATPQVRGCVVETSFGAVSGCVFDTFDIGIILTAKSSNWVLSGNVFNTVGNNCQNSGSNNFNANKSSLASGFVQI